MLDNCSGDYSTFYAGNVGTLDTSITIDTSQKLESTSSTSFYTQNRYNECDFTADKNILSGTNNAVSNEPRESNIKYNSCRLISDDYLYLYAGHHYDAYMFAQASPTNTTDGIFLYTIQEYADGSYQIRQYLHDSVLYSRDDIYYYQNTKIKNLNPKFKILKMLKFIYNTMFYCKKRLRI